MYTTTVLALLALLAPASPPSEEALQPAEQSAALAIKLYEAGDFEAAAYHFLHAYERSSHPIQLRNAAKSLAQAGQQDEALRRWREFTRLEITAEQRTEALTAIAILEARLEADWAKEKARRAEERAAARESRGTSAAADTPVARYVAGGVGGAAFVGGGILYASGWLTYASAEDGTITMRDAQAARTRSGLGLGVAIAGAGLFIGALLWPDSPAADITLAPAFDGAALAWIRSF